MDLVQGLAAVYVLTLLAFTLGFLVNWYRNRETMSAYKRIGFWAGVIFVIFELLTLGLSGGMLLSSSTVLVTVGLLGWGILRMWGFVNNGIFFSNKLNLRSFPLIAPHLGVPPVPVETQTVDPMAIASVEGSPPIVDVPIAADAMPLEPIGSSSMPATPLEPEPIAPPIPAPLNWPRYWLNIAGVVIGVIAYSAVLFLIAQPRPGLIAQNLLSSDVQIITPLTLVIILEFAFVEELIFRLGIQNYLGAKLINQRYGYAIAIALTAALWSIAHVGSLDPDWVKLAQIFPLGLALGWLYRRQGMESTIMAHALFNVLGGLLLPPLYLR